MNFKDSYVPATKRKSIQHLTNMSPLDFISFCRQLLYRNRVLSNLNSSISEKIDGFGFRFGSDSFGNFFIESSQSGPIFSKGSFRQYSIDKYGATNDIAEAYEQLFSELESNKPLRFLLNKYNKNGIKVICECLFSSLGKQIENRKKFVSIEYDIDKLGTFATFSIIKIVDNEGTCIECLDDFLKLSTSKTKIMSSKLNDFEINFSNQLDPNIDLERYTKILKNMKRDETSLKEKTEVKQTLSKIQNEIKTNILSKLKKGMLGKFTEGFVVTVEDVTFKVVTEDFKLNHD